MTREMKDSGIKWVHDIPKSWNVTRGKYLFVNKKEVVGAKVDEFERLALTLNGVIKRSKDDSDGLQPDKFDTYQILRKNELVFKLIDLQNISTSRVGLSPYVGIVSPAYIILKTNKKVHPQFAEKYYLMMWMNQIFNILGDAGVRSSLNAKELLELPLPLPPLIGQRKIAEYLDKKCSEIDSISQDVQKQVEVLEEYKRSAIIEAVTHGLNPSAPMKDSGIRYIGKIPAHWNTDKLKYHLKRNEPRNPGNKQVLSLYREYGVIPKDSRDDNHNVTSEDTSKYKYVTPGGFVINKMKAWQGSVGISDYEGIISPAYFVYKFSDSIFVKKYFHYLLRSCYKDEFRRLSGGIREGQWDLSPEGLENTVLLIPPQEEQKEIANYLDKKCSEIDSVIADKKAQLETIEKYKKSLIYEYVTGKKEVINE